MQSYVITPHSGTVTQQFNPHNELHATILQQEHEKCDFKSSPRTWPNLLLFFSTGKLICKT